MPRPKAAKRRQPASKTNNHKKTAAIDARTNVEHSRNSIVPRYDDTHVEDFDMTPARAPDSRFETPRRESRQPNYNRNKMINERSPNSRRISQASGLALPNSAGKSRKPWEPRASMNRPGNMNSKLSTPGIEASILSAFRPRPRQPSILQIVGNDSSSDLDEEDFLGHLDSNDESTPFGISKRKILPLEGDHASPIARPKSPTARSYRDISRSPSMIPDSYPNQQVEEDEEDEDEGQGNDDNEEEMEVSVREASVEASVAVESPSVTPQPQSSPVREQATGYLLTSSQNSILKSPSSQFLLSQDSNIYSSPAQAEPIEPSKPAQVSTSRLQQNLLPRRTRRSRKPEHSHNSTRDFSPEALGESLATDKSSRSRSRAKRSNAVVDEKPKRLRASKTSKYIKVQGTSNPAEKAIKSPGPSNRVRKSNKNKNSKTYSRQSDILAAEKENQEREPSPAEPPVVDEDGRSTSEELLRQKEKFAEVDQWSMDFEDVSPEEYIY